MESARIFQEIKENIAEVIEQETSLGQELWSLFIQMHPADIAQFFSDISKDQFEALYKRLPNNLKIEIFLEMSDTLRAYSLTFLTDHDIIMVLSHTPLDELSDLFDELPDEYRQKFMTLLRKKDREKVISLRQFSPDSAGGIMDVNVFTFIEDMTIEKAIRIMQHIRPNQELHRIIYVTDRDNRLLGHILLEDLVLNPPQTKLEEITRKNPLVVNADEDKEEISKKMIHYGLMMVPVVGAQDYFLGVIPSDTLIEVIEEEASEDVYRMSAMAPIKRTYFETSFFRLLYERSYILVVLLLAESFSSTILKSYEDILARTAFLVFFIPMLISAGGNTSSQTSALAIQGMAAGEITPRNMRRFIRREMAMAIMIALVLGLAAFMRVYFTHGNALGSLVVSIALAIIVLASVVLGSCIPLVLKRLHIDPAFSAGPFLATLMDILGILIYCYVAKAFLS